MEKPLHSTTLYKSGDATMIVYQDKAKKNVGTVNKIEKEIQKESTWKSHFTPLHFINLVMQR